MLRCLGVRITVSGGPIRNLRGVLVVSGHVSWVDIFAIGAVLPGSFVAKAELIDWPALGVLARFMKVIPIDRTSLRAVAGRGEHHRRPVARRAPVVAFPEGTTWCGLAYGPFRPAMFQAAVDAAGRSNRCGWPITTVTAGRRPSPPIGDTLFASICRLVTARRTVVHVRSSRCSWPERPPRPGRPLRGRGSRRVVARTRHALVA